MRKPAPLPTWQIWLLVGAAGIAACGDASVPATTVGPPAPGSTRSIVTPTTGSPATTTTASDATIPTTGPRVVSLGDEVDLATGDEVRVEDPAVRIVLLEASGPGDDCNDCPSRAILEVTTPSGRQELAYTFSGMMTEEALAAARSKEAFGLVFVAQRIWNGEMTVLLEAAP